MIIPGVFFNFMNKGLNSTMISDGPSLSTTVWKVQDAAQFIIQSVGDGYYRILNKPDTNLALSIRNVKDDVYTAFLGPYSNSPLQQWSLIGDGSGQWVMIKNRETGLCLGFDENGPRLQEWNKGGDYQRWRVNPVNLKPSFSWDNIRLGKSHPPKKTEHVDLLARQVWINQGDVTLGGSYHVHLKRTCSFEWYFKVGVKLSFSQTYKMEIPGVGGAENTVGLEISAEHGQSGSTDKTIEYGANTVISVEPHKCVEVWGTINWIEDMTTEMTGLLNFSATANTRDGDDLQLNFDQLSAILVHNYGFEKSAISAGDEPHLAKVTIEGAITGTYGLDSKIQTKNVSCSGTDSIPVPSPGELPAAEAK